MPDLNISQWPDTEAEDIEATASFPFVDSAQTDVKKRFRIISLTELIRVFASYVESIQSGGRFDDSLLGSALSAFDSAVNLIKVTTGRLLSNFNNLQSQINNLPATIAALGGRYVGILNQTGTNDPIATLVPVNSFGDGISWSRIGPVTYEGSPGIAYQGILNNSSNAFAVDGSTDIWMRDTTDLLSLQILDPNTVQIIMAADGDLTNRRIEIMNSKVVSNIMSVLSIVLTGLSIVTATPITSTDTILTALGKLQKQINVIIPAQAGNAGKVLSTDGALLSWQAPVPSQAGNAGKVLSTDGALLSWQAPVPSQAGNAGKVLSTDGASLIWQASSGSNPFYWMPAFVRPVLADFSWINQGAASANNNGGLIWLSSPGDSASENLKCLVKNKTGQYTIDMFFIPTFNEQSYNQGGLVLRDSVSGKCLRFVAFQDNAGAYQSRIGVARLSNATTYYNDAAIVNTIYGNGLIGFRIVVDTIHITFLYSFDMVNYITLFQQGIADWGTIDQVGLCAQAYNITSPAAISCIHWKES